MTSNWFVNMAYFIAAIVFIFGLKAMASPVTARKGVVWAGYGDDRRHRGHLLHPRPAEHRPDGGGDRARRRRGLVSGKVVKMTDMPQMVAIYNGMGGGAAAGIAAIELRARGATRRDHLHAGSRSVP
jgi:NAD(P) transhydrogenase subunit beta